LDAASRKFVLYSFPPPLRDDKKAANESIWLTVGPRYSSKAWVDARRGTNRRSKGERIDSKDVASGGTSCRSKRFFTVGLTVP
jgi:hypothetical protein